MKNREKKWGEFIQENGRFFQEPVIQTFLAVDDHWDLLKAAIEQNDLWASDQLDQRFEVYYLRVRMMRYIATLTRLYVNTYDQSKRKQRSLLTFDQPVDAEGEEQLKQGDYTPSLELALDDAVVREVPEILPTEAMQRTYRSFSDTRKNVMHFYTFDQLNDKEISGILNCTPQNVSKTRRKALAQLQGS
ncbi:hypothetical protein HUG15_21670 [Salicibibacter cibarius]|uniref:Sigma-70 family RNA polymerase sigma factor n=1 Tax=Salicibibacter cibarius TaxID=2743000 RepID=A0A7T7CDE5_9BACI|nr:hypothetical protein [Salicibibacter cibarius]QQK77929.1 hypothetical protein HUG15_21670 [Salicibibacter cibarius]